MKVKVGIINVTGYAGVELARILARHPNAEITSVTGRSAAGQKLGDVFPHLSEIDLTIAEDVTESVDVVFSALPHAASAERIGNALAEGVKAIDISADFRLNDLDVYEDWYSVQHPCPEHMEGSVYGLTELHRDEVSEADLVAKPRLLSNRVNHGTRSCGRCGYHRRGRDHRRQVRGVRRWTRLVTQDPLLGSQRELHGVFS